MNRRAALWLRADAVFDAGMGALLLVASWNALYAALGLRPAAPAMYAQVAGGLLLGFAYLLWTGATALASGDSPRRPRSSTSRMWS